jgi:hypothetical protein
VTGKGKVNVSTSGLASFPSGNDGRGSVRKILSGLRSGGTGVPGRASAVLAAIIEFDICWIVGAVM